MRETRAGPVDGTRRSAVVAPEDWPATPAGDEAPGRAGRPGVGGRDPVTRSRPPAVLAAVCPAGHLTPAYSGVCRVCRRAVAGRRRRSRPRGRRSGGWCCPEGGALLLDRGAVLGRAPHVPTDWSGAPPHLVALPDPDHDVSAQHVSVVLDLWNVLGLRPRLDERDRRSSTRPAG